MKLFSAKPRLFSLIISIHVRARACVRVWCVVYTSIILVFTHILSKLFLDTMYLIHVSVEGTINPHLVVIDTRESQ
jgi:hypothetical protein